MTSDGRFYRFVWSQNFGLPLQIAKEAKVEALAFGKLRAVLVRVIETGQCFIVDRYALRKISTGSTGSQGGPLPGQQEKPDVQVRQNMVVARGSRKLS
jgi:hypothetical protein